MSNVHLTAVGGSGRPASRSRIGDEIAVLAQRGGLSHDEIAALVRRRVPGAETTAKSVASVVHALRRGGVHIPRRPTGPLPAEAAPEQSRRGADAPALGPCVPA